MGIISSSVASVSSAYAPQVQTSAPMRGDAAVAQQMSQATVVHASHAGTAAIVSMSSGGQMRHASYGVNKSADATFEKEKKESSTEKADGDKGGRRKHVSVVA